MHKFNVEVYMCRLGKWAVLGPYPQLSTAVWWPIYRQRDLQSAVWIHVPITEYFLSNVFTANINGGFVEKANELETLLCGNNVDIACITETWLQEMVQSEVLNLTDYKVHHNNRQDQRRGGDNMARCSMYCPHVTELGSSNTESVWLLSRRPKIPRVLTHIVRSFTTHRRLTTELRLHT